MKQRLLKLAAHYKVRKIPHILWNTWLFSALTTGSAGPCPQILLLYVIYYYIFII
jgi:hypothetical protein